MKCIKVIKSTKYAEVGEIKRVNEQEADEKVSTGYWMYIPKSEWKQLTRKPKSDESQLANIDAQTESNQSKTTTIAEKQLKRKNRK
jgi:hypothetical protein